ncbi:succinate dehydrogenase cytochrome b subunit [Nocardioides sp. T2.26MG-1]|uniref:succinate dehydrogenase cytochrome b subunit n=1 Tax=Nocardioides sp. T2.26MG-1 TaxID=3041166 RepID=UPI00254073FA|nr:succinate dehydrogenase cytochrome b subunit [Nocardioides sp. T2.26MG-1]
MATTTLVKGARASRSTITLKLLMAVSGLLFIAFVLLHMYGNLKAFAGHDSYNTYAEHLRTFGEPILPREGLLWILRLGLIAALALHLYSALALWHRSGKARTSKYVVKKNLGSSFSSRTMRWGGVTLLLFVVWHLIHFTIVKVNPDGGATNDPYNLVVDSFQVWWMTIIYLVAMAALGLHLHHGTWSSLQTLGWTSTAAARTRAKIAGWVVAIVIAGGFSLVPLFVLFGVID